MDWNQVKHFTRGEFGRHGDIEPDEDLVRMLDQARDIAGVPFVINSGIRSPERNEAVGGVESSAHLTGHAVDIRCPSSRHRFLMIDALIIAGFRRIGVGETFLHCDTDPDKPQGVIWTY
jgi:uncharacterized protein YcbK (DUF882 family)